MTSDTPYQGHFVGRAHHFALHVYFEDTDFSGLVYHANYLRYMERARSDMLSRAGIDQNAAFQQGEGVYAVTNLAIKYRRPARFDDDLLVISTVERLAAASVDIHQRVMLGSEVVADALLTDALVTAAFLTPNGRPRRQPEAWRAAFQSLLPETTPYA
jgi:acyl-CoA thioester hydrolase